MLPFLDKKRIVGSILEKRGKKMESAPEVMATGGEVNPPGLHSACEDMLMAIESKSAIDLAKAFRDAFESLDEDDDEGDSESDADSSDATVV